MKNQRQLTTIKIMLSSRTIIFKLARHKQRGAALMVMLIIMTLGSAAFLVSALNSSSVQIERDKKTADALAQAKNALIGYAASVALTPAGTKRPGDLPCPDINNDGSADTPCNGNALGRLPWKTLGLPDFRDSSGERLWYAVSANFKNSPRTATLNSDTLGSISVFAKDGNLSYDGGATGTGVIAVLIAPGAVLQRTDKITPQDRSSVGSNNPVNYLDIALGQDNASFTDGLSTDGLIQGIIKDSNQRVILNDQLLVITQENIMRAIQKRVAAEVKQCLNEYASDPQNNGRLPWSSRVRDTGTPPSYSDRSGYLFGRIPDSPFKKTCEDSGGGGCDQPAQSGGMWNNWRGNCNIASLSGWWLNWKEMTFYALADAYKPVDPITAAAVNACSTTGACLSVNPPSATTDKKFAVIVAGKMLPGQSRSTNIEKGTFSNYLEAPNPVPPYSATPVNPTSFSQGVTSATFNDAVSFQ
ncbi:MAG: hypothetical protein HOO97_04335 [Sideroxydans sp.]|nr:hypothetical protein [Sideroxydans sp.]